MVMGGIGSRTVRALLRNLAAATFATGTLAGAAAAQSFAALPNTATIGKVESTGGARPVQGWVKFCERYPGECDLNTAEPAVVTPGSGAKTWIPARSPTTCSWLTAFGRCRSAATRSGE